MRQILVNKLHGNGPLTYCGCHPLDGAVPYVPGNKYTRDAGFQQVRLSGLVPSLRHFPIHFEIDPTGSLLFAANEKSDNIVVFHINPRTGRLAPTGKVLEVSQPVCIKFVPVD